MKRLMRWYIGTGTVTVNCLLVAVFLTIGIPSISRVNGHAYLLKTVQSVVSSMTSFETSAVKVVVFLADLDPTYNNRTAEAVLQRYGDQVEAGLVTILRVIPEYYPPLVGLHRNFGDSVCSLSKAVTDDSGPLVRRSTIPKLVYKLAEACYISVTGTNHNPKP